jgi:hypothetical protein
MTDAVTDVERQAARLVDAGFEIADQRGPEAFGNRLIELSRGSMIVWLVQDRDQSFLTLGTRRGAARHDLGLWLSCLDHQRPRLEPRDFEADVELLLRRFSELESFVEASGHDTERCLKDAGEWRFSERRSLGLIRYPTS